MQVGCCIRRTIASFGTVTAVALIAATGFAGSEPMSHDAKGDNARAQNTMNSSESRVFDKNEFYNKTRQPLETMNVRLDAGDLTNVVAPAQSGKAPMNVSAPTIQRGAPAGADSCATATDLDAALAAGMGTVSLTGDTTGAPYIADDAVNPELPAAPCAGTFGGFDGGGAKWYSLTGTGNPFLFDGCTSLFDTTFTVMSGDCMATLVCEGGNDDGCGAAQNFASVGSFDTDPGTTYYILIHGWSGDEGVYDFTLTEGSAQTVDCSMADRFDIDGDGDDMTATACVGGGSGGVDNNPGCNGTSANPLDDFQTLFLNGQTCGIVSTDSVAGPRDLDWFIIDIPAGPAQEVTITASGDGPFNFFQVDFTVAGPGVIDCTELAGGTAAVVPFGDAGATNSPLGAAITGTACLGAGQHVVVVGNTDFVSFDCGVNEVNYSLEVSSGACPVEACCLPDGTCMTMTNPDCVAAGGEVQDGVLDCNNLQAMNGTCTGYCCLLDGTIASGGPGTASADDCDTLVASGTARGFLGYELTAMEQMDAFCPVTPNNVDCATADLLPLDGTPVLGNSEASTYVVDEDVNPELPGTGCGAGYGGSPGLWYTFTGTGNTVTLGTCAAASDYDTAIAVFCGDCSGPLFCVGGNDDASPACSFGSLLSEATVCTEVGTTYYVLVFGFGTGSGNFELSALDSGAPCMDAEPCAICEVECPMGAFTELNESCATPPGTEGNNGCDDAAATGTTFVAEELFIDDVFCGNIGARDGVADSDWFVLVQDALDAQQLTITVESEADLQITLLNYLGNTGTPQSDAAAGANCDNVDLVGPVIALDTTGNCQDPAVIEICLTPGEWFLVIDGSTQSEACVNDQYVLTMTSSGMCVSGACCAGDGTCTDNISETECLLSIGGVFTAGATCGVDVTCLGACCTQAAIPGDPNPCTETDFDSCTTDPNFLVWNGIETTCADMDVDCGTRPINDECDGAIALDTMGTPATATVGTVNLDNSTWYSFIGTGNEVTISLCGSTADADDDDGNLDTAFNVFCRGCTEQRFIISNDDSPNCPSGLESELTICTEAGTEYLIEAFAFLGESGTIEVTVTDSGTPCMDAPDCSPSGACCLDEMTQDCVQTTQDDCENNLMGCFTAGGDCGFAGYDIQQDAGMPLTEIGPSSTPLAQTAAGQFALIDDEAFATVNLPFDFEYFGVNKPAGTPLFINVNGFATFEDLTGSTDDLFSPPPGGDFPNAVDPPNGVIAPQWTDFITNGNAANGLFAQAVDTNMDMTDDQLIIEWNVSPFAGDANIVFQLILNADNTICFRYGGDGFGPAPAAGLEDDAGTVGTNVLGELGTISLDDKITLTYNPGMPLCPTGCDFGGDTGACCIMGVCSIETEADCLAAGGEYGGNGTACMDVTCNQCVADFDNDGDVDLSDFGTFGAAFGSMLGDANYNPAADFDSDDDVDLSDFGTFGSEFGRTDCHMLSIP